MAAQGKYKRVLFGNFIVEPVSMKPVCQSFAISTKYNYDSVLIIILISIIFVVVVQVVGIIVRSFVKEN